MKQYQPKVKQTQKHSDSRGEHIVHPAKLILLDQPSDIYPIIISETEDIYNGDMAFGGLIDEFEIREIKDTYGGRRPLKAGEFGLYKILALPEHFSDKHLQAIVDGKMKDGDFVYIKAESI